MKKLILSSTVLFLAGNLLISSCKKDETPSQTTTTVEDEKSIALDENELEGESDQITSDVNLAIKASNGLNKTSSENLPGAFLYYDAGVKKITLKYDSITPYQGKYRAGVVIIELIQGTKWADTGAVVKVSINRYRVNGHAKNITFSGTKYITNVRGGTMQDLLNNGDSLEHKIHGNLVITFPNGKTRSWYVAQDRKYARIDTSDYTVTILGDTTVAGHTGTVTGGVTKHGAEFYTVISKPVVIKKSCGWDHPVAGEKIVYGKKNFTVIFGVNSDGSLSNETCPSYYKVVWNSKGGQKQAVINY